VGDSIFVISTTEGSVLKLFIEKRAAASNSFFIKYGSIGEAGESREIPCSEYTAKNFIYFSFASGEVLDIEPETTDWDLLFTRYYDESIPYYVTGVLTNMDRETAEIRNTDPGLADPATAEFSSHISVIGSDWKAFDMGSFSYVIEPDLCYFVKKGEDIYKITFTGTDGSATGKIAFNKEKE
jgi:hypothetical protein